MQKVLYTIGAFLFITAVYFSSLHQNASENGRKKSVGDEKENTVPDSETIRVEQDDESCSLQKKACIVTIPALGQITLEITPREIRMNTPLNLIVTTDSELKVEVWVDFVGIDLNMGYNRIALPTNDKRIYLGEATLPACAMHKFTWQATLLIKYQGKMFGVPFKFITEKK